MYGNFKPKFAKQFAHIRAEMLKGLNAFHAETLSGEFPTLEYCFNKQVEIPQEDWFLLLFGGRKMTKYSGYAGRVCEIDLYSKQVREYPWSDKEREMYLGGIWKKEM